MGFREKSPLPAPARAARIGCKRRAVECERAEWIFADRAHAGAAEVQDPGLLGEFLRRRQHGGIEQGDVGAMLRIAHRFIADA